MIEALEDHFINALDLPQPAADWLLDLWRVIQVFDDIHDGDEVADVMPALWAGLVTMPGNPFYQANAAALQAAVATAILKWHAANEAEAAGEADARSFVWRAAYYDVVLLAVGVGVVFAVNVGIAAKPLEHLGAQETGDQRADQRQEDDGS